LNLPLSSILIRVEDIQKLIDLLAQSKQVFSLKEPRLREKLEDLDERCPIRLIIDPAFANQRAPSTNVIEEEYFQS